MKRALVLLLLILAAPPWAAAQEKKIPILRTELEKPSAIPGQPIILRITLLAPTWLPKAPVFPSFETANVIVRLPPRASGSTSERIGGQTWSGVTRAYRLYPMTVGRFRISPQTVAVTYADPDTRAPLVVELHTEAVVFSGMAPAGAEDLDPFIAAEALTIEQSILGEPGTLEPGDAIMRTVTVRVKGTSSIFLPPLIPPLAGAGITAYAKEPVVTESHTRDGVSGARLESVTYVAEAGGRHRAPPILLRWFNLAQQRVETAMVEGFDIAVRGPPPTPTPPPSTFDWRAAAPRVVLGALLAVLVGFAAVRLWPHLLRWRRLRREATLASEAFAFTRALAALRAHDFGDAMGAVRLWSSRLPPGAEQARLSAALARLGAARYGRERQPSSPRQWSEAVDALRAARRERLTLAAAEGALPPLNPRPVI